MNEVMVVDCRNTGISGDKFLASLIDIGGNIAKIKPLISSILKNHSKCKRFEFIPKQSVLNGFNCMKLKINIEEEKESLNQDEIKDILKKDLENLSLSKSARKFVDAAFNIILKAEASIHGVNIKEVHLHEISSADTFFDIIGSALLLDDLDLFTNVTWTVLPIAVGSGEIQISHGIVSTPAPATMKIIQDNGFIMKGVNIESELTTPTGVALLAALKAKSEPTFPIMDVLKIGYGGGTKEFQHHPNIMRLIHGNLIKKSSLQDEIMVLETNMDDISGEAIGNFINKMSSVDGLKDVSVIQTITKKNRPGFLIKILTDVLAFEKIKNLMFKELGTLGIRHYSCMRSILYREIEKKEINIDNTQFQIRIKIARLEDGTLVNIKPEYEDIKRIAISLNKPYSEILRLINNELK
ncbi:MAG: nickel pincer cofactor biosynthesis protein LarC [Candidatus Helarchaeota archaeon]